MSGNDHDPGAPIVRGSPLAQKLDGYAPPPLSAGFAERVLAAAEVRPAPLPELRRPAAGRRGWRTGRRIAIGIASFGALATAAAATGLLERFDLPVPSAGAVWASLTGRAAPAQAPAPKAGAPVSAPGAIVAPARVEIVGPVDTPEELGEAFRRIDEVRADRREARRQMMDRRIADEIERRRAAGLRVPTPEEEARLRERIDTAQTRHQHAVDARINLRREELQRKVEEGEALTREDVLRPLREDARALQRRERTERLRQLPPEQRRALVEEFRARRAERLGTPAPAAAPSADPAPAPSPAE